MTKLLLLAAGGALGAILRYSLSGLVHRFLGESFPWGTLVINLTGCLAIGFLWGVAERAPFGPGVQLFVFVGVLGAYTTFSTFGLETLNLMRDGEIMFALLNVGTSALLGILLVFLGIVAARTLFSLGGAP